MGVNLYTKENMKESIINFIKENFGEYINSLLEKYLSNEKKINSQPILNESSIELISENKNILRELELLDVLNENIFFEMASLYREDTGLKFTLWIDDAGKRRKIKHNEPRLKVEDPDDSDNFVSISISMNPEVLAGEFKKKQKLKDVFEFIKENYTELMAVWNNQKNTRNMQIIKIK